MSKTSYNGHFIDYSYLLFLSEWSDIHVGSDAIKQYS